MPNKYQRHQPGFFTITATSCRNGSISGTFCHPIAGETGAFSSLLELILKMDNRLNEEESPQAFSAIRSFCPPRMLWMADQKTSGQREESIGSFAVYVMFRRNATWQGTVTWMEGNQSRHFRSVLELVSLISSAVQTHQMPGPFREREGSRLELAE